MPLLFILILQTPNSFPSCVACFFFFPFNVRETAEAILLWVILMLTFKSAFIRFSELAEIVWVVCKIWV